MRTTFKALSEIAKNKIEIEFDIPEVKSISEDLLKTKIQSSVNDYLIYQDYHGPIDGRVFLLFPKTSSIQLVKMIIGSQFPAVQLAKLEHDSLLEVGNIIINSSLKALESYLNIRLTTDLPEFCPSQTLLKSQKSQSQIKHQQQQGPQLNNKSLYIHSFFHTGDESIQGELALVFNQNSIENLEKFNGKLSPRS